MADYENRTVPEGINVSPTHPLKEFAVLFAGMSVLVVLLVVVVAFLGGWLARYIPFEQERVIAAELGKHLPAAPASALHKERGQYLQALSDRLAGAMALPPEMRISVHYSGDKTVNAMATLGGHVVVYQGLLDKLPSENALAFVLAHEIAHVRHRHPVVAMGRGFSVMLLLSALTGMGDGILGDWLGSLGLLPVLSFNREQESEADADALQAVYRSYGHVRDAGALFDYLAAERNSPPQILSTHPADQARSDKIRRFADSHPPTTADPVITPLPAFVKSRQGEDCEAKD